jgi:hypothetical protein
MAETTVRLVDQKGEKFRQHFSIGTFDEEAYTTDLAPMSFCGTEGHLIVTPTPFTAEKAADVSTDTINDGDYKASCTFKYLNGFIRLQIPAPKINIEAGIIVRLGEKRQFIPKTKKVGEVGHDGSEIATMLEGVLGLTAGDLTFASGRISKRP